ncbi:hypothetical protein R6Q59_026346, partial [Mikania micrantha]
DHVETTGMGFEVVPNQDLCDFYHYDMGVKSENESIRQSEIQADATELSRKTLTIYMVRKYILN